MAGTSHKRPGLLFTFVTHLKIAQAHFAILGKTSFERLVFEKKLKTD